jgi:gamma-glutamylcyclotransferase (GGCT)/AIG2-like uncharacterized protein YtfP
MARKKKDIVAAVVEPDPKHTLFVYGTLMSGMGYWEVLRHKDVEFLGPAKTVEQYPMYGGGYPMLVDEPGWCRAVGEVYTAPKSVLTRVDAIENYKPGRKDNLYARKPIEVMLADGSKVEAWCYFISDPYVLRRVGSGIFLAVRNGSFREYHAAKTTTEMLNTMLQNVNDAVVQLKTRPEAPMADELSTAVHAVRNILLEAVAVALHDMDSLTGIPHDKETAEVAKGA